VRDDCNCSGCTSSKERENRERRVALYLRRVDAWRALPWWKRWITAKPQYPWFLP
jgi:hypothetical protein